jgi:hypothetical protein
MRSTPAFLNLAESCLASLERMLAFAVWITKLRSAETH